MGVKIFVPIDSFQDSPILASGRQKNEVRRFGGFSMVQLRQGCPRLVSRTSMLRGIIFEAP
jgi:hypothetical protein